jgi:hypothetical protein
MTGVHSGCLEGSDQVDGEHYLNEGGGLETIVREMGSEIMVGISGDVYSWWRTSWQID